MLRENSQSEQEEWEKLVRGDATPPPSWTAKPARFAAGDARLNSVQATQEIRSLTEVGDLASLTLEKFKGMMPRMTPEALAALSSYLGKIQSGGVSGLSWNADMASISDLISRKPDRAKSIWLSPVQ